MKIKLLKDHSIRGEIAPAESIVVLHEGVAQDLVDRGIAEKVEKKPAKKKADS